MVKMLHISLLEVDEHKALGVCSMSIRRVVCHFANFVWAAGCCWGLVPCVVLFFCSGRSSLFKQAAFSSSLLLACGLILFCWYFSFRLNLGWPDSVLLSCDNGTRLV
jgi:bacteriorhodopsin